MLIGPLAARLAGGVAIAAVLAAGYCWWRADVHERRADVAEANARHYKIGMDAAVAANQDTLEQLEERERLLAAAEREVTAALAAAAARAAELRRVRAEIVADASQSCPVAPVLLHALDGVRRLRDAAAGGHAAAGGAGESAGWAADVPGRP